MPRTLKVTGNHVMYLCMISKDNHVKFARFVWLAVGEEAKQRPGLQMNVYCRDIFFFRSMYSKTTASASADNSYLDLDYSEYHKNLTQYFFFIKSCSLLIFGYDPNVKRTRSLITTGEISMSRASNGRAMLCLHPHLPQGAVESYLTVSSVKSSGAVRIDLIG